jgi:hypothetical protein
MASVVGNCSESGAGGGEVVAFGLGEGVIEGVGVGVEVGFLPNILK